LLRKTKKRKRKKRVDDPSLGPYITFLYRRKKKRWGEKNELMLQHGFGPRASALKPDFHNSTDFLLAHVGKGKKGKGRKKRKRENQCE